MRWSTLILGNVHLIHISIETTKYVFMKNHMNGGKNGPCHPPRNNVVATAETRNMFVYSARKNIANFMPLYSVIKPDTSSDSASGRSKGALFISAFDAIRNKTNPTGCKNTYHIFDCAATMSPIFREPA